MAMSKKDYVAVAAAIKNELDRNAVVDRFGAEFTVTKEISESLAKVFAADNPRFNRVVFLAACGVA